MNSRHPDPRRVWKGGPEQHFQPPFPVAPLAPALCSRRLVSVRRRGGSATFTRKMATHFQQNLEGAPKEPTGCPRIPPGSPRVSPGSPEGPPGSPQAPSEVSPGPPYIHKTPDQPPQRPLLVSPQVSPGFSEGPPGSSRVAPGSLQSLTGDSVYTQNS